MIEDTIKYLKLIKKQWDGNKAEHPYYETALISLEAWKQVMVESKRFIEANPDSQEAKELYIIMKGYYSIVEGRPESS